MADYQTKTDFVDAVQFDSKAPLPPGVEAAFVLVHEDGIREPLVDGEWIVTDDDGEKRIYPESYFPTKFEPKTIAAGP